MKKILLSLLCFMTILCLCSCSEMDNVPDEEKVLADYCLNATEYRYANFYNAEFIRQQYQKENKKFMADVKLTGKDDYAHYESIVSLVYNYYDDQGWMLDDFSNVEPTCKCFAGMPKEEILKYNFVDYVGGGESEYISEGLQEDSNIYQFLYEVKTEGYLAETYRYYILFKYTQGEWIYDTTEKERIEAFFDIEGTTWIAPGTGWLNNFHKGPDITILSVSGTDKISIQYEGEVIDATHKDHSGPGYVFETTNTNTIEKIYLQNFDTNNPNIILYPPSSSQNSSDWMKYKLKTE